SLPPTTSSQHPAPSRSTPTCSPRLPSTAATAPPPARLSPPIRAWRTPGTPAPRTPAPTALRARRLARHWTNFARTLDPGPGWRPYRATSAPGGNNIEVLSIGRAATGALAVPADPVAAYHC